MIAGTLAEAHEAVESVAVTEGQRPLELILARNLMAGLSTPAFLVDEDAVVVFYNEAAGALLGRRFEEAGPDATGGVEHRVRPDRPVGEPIDLEQLPLTIALRRGRPAHHRFRIQSQDERRARDRGERDTDRDHGGHSRGHGVLLVHGSEEQG